ncbi:MAG: DeoR/GlpR family DNA-binding transcription regulator, partial [Oscillospiraceae bacterium]|nr:DeoR/GlpR family DNA-binding transcription regulator [Oscillospiraceae bacterium]
MLAEQRTEVILSELAERRAVSVTDLCHATGASEATIRRDLNMLARQRRLKKVHGGAVLLEEQFHVMEPDMEVKRRMSMEEKDRIARYAVSLIEDDDVVYMDAGTSVLQMVQHLQNTKALFVTNNIECAFRLMEKGLRTYV